MIEFKTYLLLSYFEAKQTKLTRLLFVWGKMCTVQYNILQLQYVGVTKFALEVINE